MLGLLWNEVYFGEWEREWDGSSSREIVGTEKKEGGREKAEKEKRPTWKTWSYGAGERERMPGENPERSRERDQRAPERKQSFYSKPGSWLETLTQNKSKETLHKISWPWWHTPLLSALRRLRQEDYADRIVLCYTLRNVSSNTNSFKVWRWNSPNHSLMSEHLVPYLLALFQGVVEQF